LLANISANSYPLPTWPKNVFPTAAYANYG
jgi:hypothetical protein